MDECIRSLNAQTYPNFRTLVVDNGSTDGSVEWLKEHEIPSVFLPDNIGFPGAVNIGIKKAQTPYVILLNNDTEPKPDYIREMIRMIERSPKIFSVSSRILQLYHKELMDDAGDMYSLPGCRGLPCGKRNQRFQIQFLQGKTGGKKQYLFEL